MKIIKKENYKDVGVIKYYSNGDKILVFNENITTIGNVYLSNNQLTDIDFKNITTIGNVDLFNNQLTKIDFKNITTSGNVDLFNNQLTDIDFKNITKIGNVYLYHNQLTDIDFKNITKIGNVDLSHNQLTKIDFKNITTIGIVDLSHNQLTSIDERFINQCMWIGIVNVNKGMFDIIRCNVVYKRQLRHITAYVTDNTNLKYVVFDGENYSHGETLRQAKEDLIFKLSNRDTSQYENLTLESTIKYADAIKMYRTITGACEAGTKHFINNILNNKIKKTYKIKEIIELTKNQYGNLNLIEFFK